MGFEKFVKFLGRFPAASVFIRIMGRRVFGLVFNDVHAAWGFDVQAEGTRAIAVPLHFLAVKLLEVKEQFAEAPFIIRNGFRITAQKINDIKLPGRFFQGNPVFQGVWNGDFRKGCTGGRSQKEQRKKCGEKLFKHTCQGRDVVIKDKENYCSRRHWRKRCRAGLGITGAVLWRSIIWEWLKDRGCADSRYVTLFTKACISNLYIYLPWR